MLKDERKYCVAHEEKLLKPLLIKLNDQHLNSGPESLIIALRQYFLVGGESVPHRSRHLVFHQIEGENLQLNRKEITSKNNKLQKSLLEFQGSVQVGV